MCDEEDELSERRANEFEALKSIFGEDIIDLREKDVWKVGRPPQIQIHLVPLNTSRSSQEQQISLDLIITMTSLYPKECPELKFAAVTGLTQKQQDDLMKNLQSLSESLQGDERVYELCIEVQNYLAQHGGKVKVFSSFHDEMEHRKQSEEKRKSDGHDKRALLDRQAIAEEIEERQKEIEEEESRVKLLQHLNLKENPDKTMNLPTVDETKIRAEAQRMKRYSECEETFEKAEQFSFVCKGKSYEVIKARVLGLNNLEGSCYSGVILETGQMIAIHRWSIVGDSCKGKKVKFVESEGEVMKQLAAIELDLQMLTKIRHTNIVGYHGFCKVEDVKQMNLSLNLIEDFCRGTTLDLYITGNHRIEVSCLQSLTSGVLEGLDYLHKMNIVHKNLRHTSIFLQPDGNVKIGDYFIDLKLRELVSQANKVDLHDEYPPSVGRGGKKCDIFRLGLILISVINGSVVQDQVPQIPDSIPSSLEDLLCKCLLKDERERWSADQLLEHAFIKDSFNKEFYFSTVETNQEPRSESPEPENVEIEAPIEPIRIDSDKESRLNQDFKIITWIGRGGFGDVIQVKNKLDDQVYAIKRIRLNPADRQLNRKIMREVKLLSRLNHENVVRYYNSWQELTRTIPNSGGDDTTTTTTTEDMTTSLSRQKGNSMSQFGFQAPSFRSPGISRRQQEDSEWSVSFMPPESDSSEEDSSDEESDSSRVQSYPTESDSDRIVFGSDSSRNTEIDQDQQISERDPESKNSSKKMIEINTLYIQMEFCEKKTLRNYIDNGLYKDAKKVWQMFREIIDGLVHIHTQGMIHRDLKPVNIFIDSHNHVKIGDFGLATTELLGTAAGSCPTAALAADTDEVKKDEFDESIEVQDDMTGLVGTALYTAPEVTLKNTTYNQKVDLYSLGVIFFEMCYPPLQTGMERIKVLTALREPAINLPQDWDSQLMRQQTYIINWLLDHDAMNRPTSHQLLMSDYLPPPLVEESRIEETVRNAMKNKKSKAYRQLISSCMNQNMSQAKDIYFDTDIIKPSSVRKHGAAFAHFFHVASRVFGLHGGVPLDTHLLLPVNQKNPWKTTDTCVQLMSRNGDVVSLPHDLRIPFARYLARLKLNNFKRYSFGKVVKEKKVFGLHPKEYTECGFDIVTDTAGQAMADAELLVICQQLLNQLGDWEDTKFIFKLCHGDLIKGLLLHLGIDIKNHSQVIEYMKAHSNHGHHQLTGCLENQGVSEAGIQYLLTLLDADTGLSQLTSLLRPVTKRRAESADLVKSALQQLKQVENLAIKLGLKMELQFSVKSLYPPSLYSGITFQIIRILTKKTSRNMDIIGAGGRYNELVRSFQDFLDIGEVANKDKTGIQGISADGCCEERLCATGVSLSVDRLVGALVKLNNFNTSLVQVVVAGVVIEMGEVCAELWSAGIKTVSLNTQNMDELRECGKELGADIIILITQENVRLSFGDKEGRFMGEKKMSVGEVIHLLTKELKLGCGGGGVGYGEGVSTLAASTVNSKEWGSAGGGGSGSRVVYNFDHLDKEKYSHSKKKLEIRKSEKLASALSRFDSNCEILVLAVGLPSSVVRTLAINLECDDEDKYLLSQAEINKIYPRYRNYLHDIYGVIFEARFKKKIPSTIVLVSLDDNSFKIIH